MANSTLSTIPHFMGWAAFGNAFVAEIAWIGVLGFGKFFQNALLLFCGLFDALIKLIPRRMFDVTFLETRLS